MHDVELPPGVSQDDVRERTLAAWERYVEGCWSHAFLIAAVFLAVELPPCPLAEWLAAAETLRGVAEGPPGPDATGEFEIAS